MQIDSIQHWSRMPEYDYDVETHRPVLIATTEGAVGEARYESDGQWWWVNSYGEYWSEPVEGEVIYWQHLPVHPWDESGDA